MARTSDAMKKYEAASAAFLQNLESIGMAKGTVNDYAMILMMFWDHMLNNGYSVQGPCFTAAQSWRNDLLADKKPSTVRHYLVVLRSFFKWASDESLGDDKYYEKNPISTTLFPRMRSDQKRPYEEILTDQQVAELWACKRPFRARGETWTRNYAIVVFLLSTELRTSELLRLKLSDLDFENEEVTVNCGKGNKYRVVDFPIIAQTAVKLYLSSGIRPEGLPDSAPLFGTTGGPKNLKYQQVEWKEGTRFWIANLVERHVYAVTGVHDVRGHDLRHIGSRLELNTGTSMEALQSKLGHESLYTTQIYCGRLSPKRRRKSASEAFEERDRQTMRNADLLSAASYV